MQFTEITSDIPVPEKRRGGLTAMMRKLEVGQSVGVTGVKHTDLGGTCSNLKRRHGLKFTTRKLEDGSIRIWRLA